MYIYNFKINAQNNGFNYGFFTNIYRSWLSHTCTPVSSCSLSHWTLPHHNLPFTFTHARAYAHACTHAHTVSSKYILSPSWLRRTSSCNQAPFSSPIPLLTDTPRLAPYFGFCGYRNKRGCAVASAMGLGVFPMYTEEWCVRVA